MSLWLCIFEFLREKTGLTNSSGSPKRDSFSVSSLPLCQQKGKKTFFRLGSTPLARANAVERKRKKTSFLRRIFPSSGPEIAERRWLRKFLSRTRFSSSIHLFARLLTAISLLFLFFSIKNTAHFSSPPFQAPPFISFSTAYLTLGVRRFEFPIQNQIKTTFI